MTVCIHGHTYLHTVPNKLHLRELSTIMTGGGEEIGGT